MRKVRTIAFFLAAATSLAAHNNSVLAATRAGIGIRTVARMIKEGRQAKDAENAERDRRRAIAERRDPRPAIPVPELDAPWLPQMKCLNEVIGAAPDDPPPCRDTRHILQSGARPPCPTCTRSKRLNPWTALPDCPPRNNGSWSPWTK